jgi:hypothetical protein
MPNEGGAMSDANPDDEFTAFIDRAQWRFRMGTSNRWLSRERHIETPAQSWVRRYNAETEQFREFISSRMERKAS